MGRPGVYGTARRHAADAPTSAVMRRLRRAVGALAAIVLAGSVGYALLGFSPLDAVYQTVTTVTTVGFRELHPLSATGKAFTIGLILVGVGTALYSLGVLFEAMVEGHLSQHLESRRMTRAIERMSDHVIICGFGRVGQACAAALRADGRSVVIVDRDAECLALTDEPVVLGDVTDDDILAAAGIERARSLVAALDSDAGNVYLTLAARALRNDLVIVARAWSDRSIPKLRRAGADEIVNPQQIGGRRMAVHAVGSHSLPG